jgi:hypothetical protein
MGRDIFPTDSYPYLANWIKSQLSPHPKSMARLSARLTAESRVIVSGHNDPLLSLHLSAGTAALSNVQSVGCGEGKGQEG